MYSFTSKFITKKNSKFSSLQIAFKILPSLKRSKSIKSGLETESDTSKIYEKCSFEKNQKGLTKANWIFKKLTILYFFRFFTYKNIIR